MGLPDRDGGDAAEPQNLSLARSPDARGGGSEPAGDEGDPGTQPGASVVALRAIDAVRPTTTPLVGTLRPMLDTGRLAVLQRAAGEAPEAVPEAEPGTPAAALAALARVDPFGAPGFAGMAGGMGGESGSDAFAGGAGAPLAGPAVARRADDSGPGDPEPGAASAWSGNRLSWTNPWLGSQAPGPSRDRTATPGAPGDATGTLRGGSGSGAQTTSRMAAAPTSLGAFAPRPRGMRVGPAVQRRVVERTEGTQQATGQGDGTTASSVPPAPATTPPFGSHGGPVAARQLAFDAPPVSLAPLQRVEADAAAPESDAGAAAGPAGPSAPGGPTGEKELDDLARRLYDRIGLRLRRDLLVDRERAGALVDRGF